MQGQPGAARLALHHSSNLRRLRRREAAEAKRENQKALPAARGPLDGVERPHALWGCLFILVVDT